MLTGCFNVTTTSSTSTSDQPFPDPDDSTGETGADSTGEPLGGSGVIFGSSGSGSDTGETSTSSAGRDSSGGIGPGSTTGGIAKCILPEDGSWCAAQREVAQAIGCRTSANPEYCYRTIVAQYTEGDWAVLAAGDCSTSTDGRECEDAYLACTNSTGPTECALVAPATVMDCQTLAQMAGIEWALSKAICVEMLSVYG